MLVFLRQLYHPKLFAQKMCRRVVQSSLEIALTLCIRQSQVNLNQPITLNNCYVLSFSQLFM